jgi:aspartate dehydrogenase
VRRPRIGLVGCGAIGRVVARAIARGRISARLAAVCDLDPARARAAAALARPPARVTSLAGVARACDVVVECASAAAVPAVVRAADRAGRDVVVLSVAGLLARPRLLTAPRRGRLLVPSGAVGALDVVRAARLGGLRRAVLTTTKPPAALAASPYVRARGLDLRALRRPRTLFSGSAAAAARGFPANLNVAATVALAGLGPRRTRVRIVADPAAHRNVHELRLEGRFGRACCRLENVPLPGTPRTSALAAYSVLAALRDLVTGARIGS